MTTTDVRLFMEVTSRQAEEAFRRQMDESNRRIEAQMTATRTHEAGNAGLNTQTRELWWSQPGKRAANPAIAEGEQL